MKALPKKFTSITQDVAPIEQWLTNQRTRVTNETAKVEAPGALWVPGLWGSTGTWFLLVFIIGAIAEPHTGIGWHWCPASITWVAGTGIGAVLALGWTIIHGIATDQLRDKARERLQLEIIDGNTLALRATLITKAAKDFEFHCSRYRELRNQVDEELVEEDSAAVERYLVFLDRAYEVLHQAIRNFTMVSERVAREEQRLQRHPELKETSLALLIDDLKVDVERPEFLTTLADPMRALAHEESLAMVIAELGQREGAT